jgi:predicted  nucleic acid-binding Zn-ribbon protein
VEALRKQNLELESSVATLKTLPVVVPRPIEPLLSQLEDMRSSHAVERQLREKEARKLGAELKAARREIEYLGQQLTDLEAEHARCLTRTRELGDELSAAQRKVRGLPVSRTLCWEDPVLGSF